MNLKVVRRISGILLILALVLTACGKKSPNQKETTEGIIPLISIQKDNVVDLFADENNDDGSESDSSDEDSMLIRDENSKPSADRGNGGNYDGVRPEAKELYLSNEVLQRSIVNQGNMSQVARVLKKAANKERIVIGTIGGSITEGTASTAFFNSYAGRFRDWWSEEYPDMPIEFYNIGKGATTSLMGAHRVGRELLDKNPDLVVVDFSVNDSDDTLYSESYESLIRQILQNENSPAVICLFMMDKRGWNTSDYHLPVAKHYNLPVISYKEALWPTNGKKLYEWSEISPDDIHPNDTGHAIINELLVNYLDKVRAKISSISTEKPALPAPLTANSFANARLINSLDVTPKKIENFFSTVSSYQFPNGWMTVNGGSLTVEISEAKNIYLMYESLVSGNGGTVSVTVDGGKPITVSADRVVTWGDCAQVVELLKGNKVGNHTITIKVTSNAPMDKFTVLGFLVS